MTWSSALTILFLLIVAGWFCYRQIRARRAAQQQRQTIILEQLSEWQQRREAWQRKPGDGIRPVKQRF